MLWVRARDCHSIGGPQSQGQRYQIVYCYEDDSVPIYGYQIVYCYEDNSVSMVCPHWIDVEEDHFFYPSDQSQAQVDRALRDKQVSAKDWGYWPCRLLLDREGNA